MVPLEDQITLLRSPGRRRPEHLLLKDVRENGLPYLEQPRPRDDCGSAQPASGPGPGVA